MLKKIDLINYFIEGCKSSDNLKIGTEHEKFIYHKHNFEVIPYRGDVSITSVLEHFNTYDWKSVYEGENVIALTKDKASITLEPGGQFELSGAPLTTVHETCIEINNHLKITKELEDKFDIGFLGIGFYPINKLDKIDTVPKKRYSQIMVPYMTEIGGLGLEMMHQSATVQANFDFTSEKDMQKKVNASSVLQPLITGLFANSPFKESNLSGYESYRNNVWFHTDQDRSGIPEFLIQDTLSFEEYVDFALKIPVYSIIRDNEYLNCTQYSFEDLMNNKNPEINPEDLILDDWINHVSTIFTEVRLKSFIEMRGADAGGYKSLCALPALWTGILYSEDSLNETLSITNKFKYEDILNFRKDVCKIGLNAEIDGQEGWTLAREILEISKRGLKHRQKINTFGDDENIHLSYLEELIDLKKSNAALMVEKYYMENNMNTELLFGEQSF
tara:strand:+ start:868 stop:2202 length:1335 start_codon:yes stop_codon:yes gene_type:complete